MSNAGDYLYILYTASAHHNHTITPAETTASSYPVTPGGQPQKQMDLRVVEAWSQLAKYGFHTPRSTS